MTRVALYLNQFFGQVGGEEQAHTGPRLVREPVGPGRAVVALLAEGEELVGTVVCGDSYFADQPDQAAAECLTLLRETRPDLLLAGPAFNAGRYGMACGALCAAATAELGIPAVTAMFDENPGVDVYHDRVTIVRTGPNAAGMRDALAGMLRVGRKLLGGEPLGRPSEAGIFPRGQIAAELMDRPAAERAVDMLMAKLRGAPFQTEVPLPTFEPAPAPAPVPDLRAARVALVTDGGLVPSGNPDGLEIASATKFLAYPIDGRDRLEPGAYDVSHGGYDNRYVKADPNRLVPLDAARELEREGRIGELYDRFLTTTGLTNPLNNSRRLGRAIAEHLKQAGVEAVILTST